MIVYLYCKLNELLIKHIKVMKNDGTILPELSELSIDELIASL